MKESKKVQSNTEFLLYQSKDGQIHIETRLENETIWLNQKQLADLFQTTVQNINIHIKNIFDEHELKPNSVIKDYLITALDSKSYTTKHYNLDMILSIGYRIKSSVATHFRQWATKQLREYIIKGFVLDDKRLKESGGGNYFDELLARIRDIRSSEKVFWRKILDIYATSIDYDPQTEVSHSFFKVMQNKMHWASHGHTAAEIIYERASADKPNMGMTNWLGDSPNKADAEVAKNYLNADELDILKRIVTMYLDFAELQALNRIPMHMKDWITKLDEFLKLTGRDILTHAGKIAHEDAIDKARTEYEKWHQEQIEQPSPVEKHFVEVVENVKKLEKKK